MSDYIKREDAMEPLYEKWKAAESRGDDDIAEIVKMDYITVSNVPSADVVEVVKCKDCRYQVLCAQCMERNGKKYHVNYCSMGERDERK